MRVRITATTNQVIESNIHSLSGLEECPIYRRIICGLFVTELHTSRVQGAL